MQALPKAIATGQRKRTGCRPFPRPFARSARYHGHCKLQQRTGTHHESGQHMLEQNQECAAATRAQEAIGTIKPTAANDALLAPFRIAPDPAMPNERAGELAMRTRKQLGLLQAIIQRLLVTYETNRRTPNHDPLPPNRCPVPRSAAPAKQPPIMRPKSPPVRSRIATVAEPQSHSVNSAKRDRELRREGGF